jgi:hypothetical protein
MRRLMIAAVFAGTALVASAGAQAMPAIGIGAANSAVTLVADGCGPGGHRNGYGRCVPNFHRPFFRRCPPGFHPTPYGCRRNY